MTLPPTIRKLLKRTSNLAGLIDSPQRNWLLGIQQVIMLGELAVNRVLDN